LNQALIDAHDDLVKSNISTMKTLVSTEEAKDPYTRGHCGRVTEYAVEIARELNLGQKDIEIIKNAGVLHDVGKIGVGDVILHKPTQLNEQEWNVIKQHPITALKILLPLKFLPREKEIILHHHERYDGNGYPEGLKGDRIPLGARILSVADAFDAMNSDRPYRRRLSRTQILNELQNSKNGQHDPRIVDAMLRCLERNPHLWNID
jgi:putative nucleotidyltransferase with HDIG domain